MKATRDLPVTAIGAGIFFMMLGVFLFALNDAMGKWLLASYPLGQVIVTRSLAALAVIGPAAVAGGVEPFRAVPRWPLQVVRAFLSGSETAMFYLAVTFLPLVDVVTFYMAGPIFVAVLAALLLGERVDRARWIAVVVGFAGVVVMLSPTRAALSWPAMIGLAGSLLFALLMIATRHLRGTADIVLVGGQTMAALVVGTLLLPLGWKSPSMADLAMLCALGVVALAGHLCVNRSLKLAPASIVVPYQYLLLVWAALLGYAIFHEVPTTTTIVGAVIIVSAGIFIFMREQRGEVEAMPET